jgi:glutaminase
LKEYTGHFAFTVGTPAKAGASGYIMVVVPDVLGYCVWSPQVDEFELSIKGLAFSQVSNT